jgi:hypothetical protein
MLLLWGADLPTSGKQNPRRSIMGDKSPKNKEKRKKKQVNKKEKQKPAVI